MPVAVQYSQTEDSQPGGVQRILKDTDERQEIRRGRSAAPKNKKKKSDERKIDVATTTECHVKRPRLRKYPFQAPIFFIKFSADLRAALTTGTECKLPL
jgi:hypothetical protein